MGYRLVCLDAGFTLLAPRRSLADALTGVLEEQGHSATVDDVRRAWEVADQWFWDEYQRPDNRTWSSDEAIERTWREYHGRMLGELGYGDRAHELLDAILASQFAADSWELYPDVEPTLAALRERNVKLGVISDWGSNLGDILDGLGLGPYLDFVLASGSVGLAKPDPALFRAALARSDVAAADGLMVGDSLRADVAGARAAGMDGLLLVRAEADGPDHRAERIEVPSDVRVIASLEELPAIVGG